VITEESERECVPMSCDCREALTYAAATGLVTRCRECGSRVEVANALGEPERPALLPGAPTVHALAARSVGAAPDARVQVADEEALRPSSKAPEARLTHTEDDELVRVRRLLCELRPDRGGPLGWAADGAPPVAGGSNWTPTLRVQTSVEVPAILPGAFASQARESRAPRLDPASVLGWLQREGTLAGGLRGLYEACAKACASSEARAKWEALAARLQHAATVVHGRKLVLAAMAEWWRETPPVDPEVAEAEAQALRSAQRAEVAGLVARQTERASQATGEALARVRGRVSVVAVVEGASE